MANANPLDGLDELLATIYETLKRQDKTLVELAVDVESLKAILTPDQRRHFEQEAAKARFGVAIGSETSRRLYDETIRRLRGK
jgi:hypothetical protein